jgi:predicted TIM-barrel fold metal-dependent hydrolase
MPKKDPTIFNCHTHIFTIDHVPNLFGKRILPLLYQVITMRLVKWYYLNLTKRNKRYRNFIHWTNKLKFFFLDVLKFTVVGYWIYTILLFSLRWVFKIISNFIVIDGFFSEQSKAAYRRYLTLGRYATYSKQGQSKVFDLLEKTYDQNTKFVVLPMDMDYMEAGKPIANYMQQLDELLKVTKNNKNSLLPFVFLDPRRLEETCNLNGIDCYENYVKRNLSRSVFHGLKMYPALGYFPFDKNLVETYKFAQQHQIPIITHCIEGTVFYRGKKKKEWNEHPILKYTKERNKPPIPIPLPQKKNYDFSTNFSHPLNYHCLLNKELLSEYLGEETDLSKLKICLAHFGGTKEWNRYSEDNWNNYNNNISHLSREDYLNRKIKNTLNHGSSRTIWWNASWLSIIYDLMIQYEGVYTDISFIVFNQELFPLLKFLLEDEKVNHKILFGTDYYVVAQKNTEKALFQNLRSYIGEELFFKIANENPKKFLSTSFTTY